MRWSPANFELIKMYSINISILFNY